MRRRFGAPWLVFAVLGLEVGCFAEVPDADLDGTDSETGDGEDSHGDSGADSSSDSVTGTDDDQGDDDPSEEGDSQGDSGSSGSGDDDDSEDSGDGSDGPSGEDSSGSEDSGSGDNPTDTDDGGSGSTSDSGDTADAGDETGDTGDGGTGTGDTGDGGTGDTGDGGTGTGDTGDGGTGTGDTDDGGTGTTGTGTPPDPCCLGLVCGMDCSMSCGTCTDYCSVDQTLCAKTWGYPEPFTQQYQLDGNYIFGYRIPGTAVPAHFLRVGLIGGASAGGSNVRIGLYDTVFNSGVAYPNNLVAATGVFALTPGRHEFEVDADLDSTDGYWLLVATSGNDWFSYDGGTPGSGSNAAIWYQIPFSMPDMLGPTAGTARDPNYQEVDFNWYAVFE